MWRLPRHNNIEEKLGKVIIKTQHGKYLLDDHYYKGNLSQRRIKMRSVAMGKTYPLKHKVDTLRQLVKHKTGTKFIDINGKIFKYKKSSKKQYSITCLSIINYQYINGQVVFWVQGINEPFTTPHKFDWDYLPYASIMNTEHGPFLYDLVTEYHEPYRRKI